MEMLRMVLWSNDIPAHTSLAAVAEGRITALEQDGNRLADQRAKEGAALQAADDDQVLVLEGFHARALEAARFAAEMEVTIADGGLFDAWPIEALDDLDLGSVDYSYLDEVEALPSTSRRPGMALAAGATALAAAAASVYRAITRIPGGKWLRNRRPVCVPAAGAGEATARSPGSNSGYCASVRRPPPVSLSRRGAPSATAADNRCAAARGRAPSWRPL